MASGCAGAIASDEPTILEACAPLVENEHDGEAFTQGSFRVQVCFRSRCSVNSTERMLT